MSSWLPFVTRLSLSLSISGKQTLGRICYIPMFLSSLLSHEPGDRLRLCKHNSWIIKTLFIHSLWSNGCCRFSSYTLWVVVEIWKGQFSWTSQWLISWVFPVKLTLFSWVSQDKLLVCWQCMKKSFALKGLTPLKHIFVMFQLVNKREDIDQIKWRKQSVWPNTH